jgi:hypothetical protein
VRVDVSQLFEEWAAHVAREERPDPGEYIDRAGPQGEELARMMDRFLRASRPPRPDEQTVELVRAWAADEPLLVTLRARQGVKRESVVDAVMRAFRLPEEKRAKVTRYYHELEAGLLDPRRLKQELVGVIAEALRTRPAQIFLLRPRPLQVEPPPMFRAPAAPAVAMDAIVMARAEPAATDEVDRLFGVSAEPDQSS